MDNEKKTDAIAARGRIRTTQKLWRFLHNVTTTSLTNLNKTALVDGKRTYTYGQMFREWERFASVFSALGMTKEQNARVGLLGSTSAEVIFAFYGLNMVGAEVSLVPSYSALTSRKVIETIRSEKLTDFIVTDDFAQANLVNDLLVRKRELGLNNVIVLHVTVAGITVNPILTTVQESKNNYLKGLYGPVCMENLLSAYAALPVSYASEESCDTAVILHTSGTTSGTGKPVALSDEAVNAAAACFYKYEGLDLPWENLVTATIVDLSNAYSLIDQVHVPFAMGATVVCVPGGILNPWFYKAIPQYGITFLFTISAMFERWIKMPNQKGLDFSSLRFVILGGASVSAADKKRYYAFMQEHGGGEITLLNGYGISELGGACCLSSGDLEDESIGYPLPGVSARLLDEETGRFRSVRDAPCEGVLYLNSPAIATTVLNGKEILKTERIQRKAYICTNDLVRMDGDGKVTFLGRANRYFINEEGKKYESGRVETEFSRQNGIVCCGVVPVYVKTTHDNIPMLCVTTQSAGEGAKEVIQKALRQIFVVEKTLSPDNIPSRVMIAQELPRNSNGKLDLYRIGRGEVEGDIYEVKPVTVLGKVQDFALVALKEESADMIKEVFDGISAELKNDLPFHSSKDKHIKQEESDMKNVKRVIDTYNAMNSVGRQMMKNMMSQTAQKFGCNQAGSCSMPDAKKAAEFLQQLNQKAVQAAPPVMRQLNQKAAQSVVAPTQQHMNQMVAYMTRMNQISLNFMEKMFEQNCKMMNQFFSAAQSPVQEETMEPAPEEEAAEAEEIIEEVE
jgi:acyl-coenzyme A synthetase/AMP-(fatty) acid ligase